MKNSVLQKIAIIFLVTFAPITIYAKNLPVKKLSTEENLKKVFNNKQIQMIKEYKTGFENIHSLADFASVYRKGIKLEAALFDALTKEFQRRQAAGMQNADDFKWLDSLTPGFETGLVAEGTMATLIMNYKTFQAKALKTPEREDDDFINLMISSFGEFETAYPKWFSQTWDYGGCSYLGKGIHSKALLSINSIVAKDKIFKSELDEVRAKAMDDILKWETFCEPKQSVIKEMNQIIKTVPLSKTEKSKLESRVKAFQKPAKNLQFNCTKGNCRYG